MKEMSSNVADQKVSNMELVSSLDMCPCFLSLLLSVEDCQMPSVESGTFQQFPSTNLMQQLEGFSYPFRQPIEC